MKLPRLPALVWMTLPVLLLLLASLFLLAPSSARAQARVADATAHGGCRAAAEPVVVVVDDASRPLDPKDPYFAEKLAARYRALSAR